MAAIITAVAMTIFLNGCGTLSNRLDPVPPQQTGNNIHHPNKIKAQLYAQHKAWKGVRYQLGGSSKKGIDCSGFVNITFKEKFAIQLPRTTHQQAKQGFEIPRSQLKTGDLVFFKTGPNVRHVGIYIENRKFLHASASKGVMISALNNRYWQKHYWKAIRL
ncbi:MAG: hypothetical protein COB71_02135 [Thiotrichales bacterium]|nr:MAG: hypothetical protein COB71_02135 [Thiotrichales bacterium]